MTLPEWSALPLRTKRSRKRLYALIASELSLTAWKSLPNNVKRSKKHLYNYIASAKNLEEYDELAKNNMRSTRLLYTYIKENASGSKPTLTIKVKDGDSNVSGATVTIGSTEKTTDASGETTYSLDYGNYSIEVEATGFEDYTENIKFRANHKTFTITLTEAEPSSGTLTVTTLDSEQAQVSGSLVFVSDEQYSDIVAFMDAVGQDPTIALGVGVSDNAGEALMMTVGEGFQPVEPIITFEAGTYYLYAADLTSSSGYVGTVSINGDTITTITLEPMEGEPLKEAEGGK